MIEATMLATWIIIVREGLEAILIVSIISAYIVKTKIEKGRLYISIGVLSAIILSMLVGSIIFIVRYNLIGLYEKIFEGLVSIIAAVFITYVIVWMIDNAKAIKRELETKISEKLHRDNKSGIILVSFIAVFREGFETVLFLLAFLNTNLFGVALGLLYGFVFLTILAFLLFRYSVRFPLKKFFKFTSIVLIVIASGVLSYGVHEMLEVLELAGFELGILAVPIWDTSSILSEDTFLGQFMKGLVGYDPDPELLRVIVYIAYWFLIIVILTDRLKRQRI